MLFSFVIPFGGMTFRGDFGIVLLWVWLGVPHLLAAIVAATMLVWVTDTRRPLSWLSGLAALFLYSESITLETVQTRIARTSPHPRLHRNRNSHSHSATGVLGDRNLVEQACGGESYA